MLSLPFILLLFLFVLIIAAYIFLSVLAKKLITPYKLSDYAFQLADGRKQEVFQTIKTPPEDDVYISLVAPAYNEQNRVGIFLEKTMAYLNKRNEKDPNFTFEIIIVDDGSKDDNIKVVQKYIQENDPRNEKIKLLPLVQNRGKGFAVKQGVIRSRGKYILMVDSDAATDIEDLEKLEKGLKINEKGYGVAIGSRAHMEEGVVRQRKWYRNILMYGFHFLVSFVGGIHDVKDTQCGFKLFTRTSARDLFLNLHIDRWCFDIDLLRIARMLAMPLVEIPVNWRDVEGSKLKFTGVVSMGIDLVLIRLFYILGLWSVKENPPLRST